MQETLSRRCSTASKQMKSPVNQNIVSSCSCFAINTCSIEANTTLSLSVAQPVKIEFHFSLVFIDSYNIIAKMAALQHISTKHWIFRADWRVCFQVLVVYFCLMHKFGYVPYTHKTWSQKFLHNTYLYLYVYIRIYIYILITYNSITGTPQK